MKRSTLSTLCMSMTFAVLSATRADADLTAAFVAGNEGWTTVNYPFRSHAGAPAQSPLAWDGGNGLPPGSVRVGDVYPETGIAAPAAWLGNRASSYGGSLTYDILIRYSDNTVYPAAILNGGTMSVYFDAPPPTTGIWQARTIPLAAGGWRVSSNGAIATADQILFVLEHLTGLYLYTEWHTGADDSNVDNIVFTTPPALPPPVVHIERLESGQVRLNWDPVTQPPAAFYEIRRSPAWPATAWQTLAQTVDSSWVEPEPADSLGAAYYRVLSLDGGE